MQNSPQLQVNKINILVAPYIDAKNLHDMTVIAGDRVKFDLKIFGEPIPEIVWTKEGVDEPLTRLIIFTGGFVGHIMTFQTPPLK